MNIVLDEAHKKKGALFTYGPLVHNPQAIECLNRKGWRSSIKNSSVSDATGNIKGTCVLPLRGEN